MRIVPITLKKARQYVDDHHRHNNPPTGWKFGVGLTDEAQIVGVATAGRPVSRVIEKREPLTIEVNRTCTNGKKNANSMLYGAVWRAAKAMGYTRCITYTQAGESGASLRAAGFVKVREIEPAPGWDRPGRRRSDIGSAGVARVLWEIRAGTQHKEGG